jgi:hypothetical protein
VALMDILQLSPRGFELSTLEAYNWGSTQMYIYLFHLKHCICFN